MLTHGRWADVRIPSLGACADISNPSERQHDILLSGRTHQSLSAIRGITESWSSCKRGKGSGDTLPTRYTQQGSNPEKFGVERETGLEPATPCLEGRYSTN